MTTTSATPSIDWSLPPTSQTIVANGGKVESDDGMVTIQASFMGNGINPDVHVVANYEAMWTAVYMVMWPQMLRRGEKPVPSVHRAFAAVDMDAMEMVQAAVMVALAEWTKNTASLVSNYSTGDEDPPWWRDTPT